MIANCSNLATHAASIKPEAHYWVTFWKKKEVDEINKSLELLRQSLDRHGRNKATATDYFDEFRKASGERHGYKMLYPTLLALLFVLATLIFGFSRFRRRKLPTARLVVLFPIWFAFFLSFLTPPPATGWVKATFQLSQKTVDTFFKAYKSGGGQGAKILGKEISQAALTPVQRAEVFVRIASEDGRIVKAEAETLFKNLQDVEGLSKTAKWVLVGERNSPQMVGALYELKAANALSEKGYKILGLRTQFSHPGKKITDIDLLVEKGGRRFAIESKAHAKSMRWDEVVADAETLLHYRKANPTFEPVFLFKTEPSELVSVKLRQMGIKKLVVDSPEALKWIHF